MECCKRKKIYIRSTQALNDRVSLHKNNIDLTENSVSKYLYESSNEVFRMMPIYQTQSHTLLQRKEKKLHTKNSDQH